MYTNRVKSLIAANAVVVASLVWFGPVALGQGTTFGGDISSESALTPPTEPGGEQPATTGATTGGQTQVMPAAPEATSGSRVNGRPGFRRGSTPGEPFGVYPSPSRPILTDDPSRLVDPRLSAEHPRLPSDTMMVPGKRTNAQGIPLSWAPPMQITGDPIEFGRQLQPNERTTVDLTKPGMFPSDYPMSIQYKVPHFALDNWQLAFVSVAFHILLVLVLAWFFAGYFFMRSHRHQWPRMT